MELSGGGVWLIADTIPAMNTGPDGAEANCRAGDDPVETPTDACARMMP